MRLTSSWRRRSSGVGFGEDRRQAEPGVVDQHVEPAEAAERPGDDPLRSGRVLEVGHDRLHLRPQRAELIGQLFETIAAAGGQGEPA